MHEANVLLLQKLTCYGVWGDGWKSFLYGRSQRVSVNSIILSAKGEIRVGVLQGSILGPLLFSNDLQAVITDIIIYMQMIPSCIIATATSYS